MRIKEGNEWKTTFQTWCGHFEYYVMLFGLFNIPASFQSYINKIVVKKLDIFVIVYLYDILIYIEDQGQAHVDIVWCVLEELRKNRFFTKLKKCCFHKDKVCFLGYVVSAQRVQIEEEKINVVKNWPEPKSIHDIQVFLGFAHFHRCFIQSFKRIAALLTSMLKMSLTLISTTPKSMNLVDEFGRGDCGENKVRRTSASTKRPTGADYLSSNYVSHVVGNSVKNVSNYLTQDAKRAFDQLYQAFTKRSIL